MVSVHDDPTFRVGPIDGWLALRPGRNALCIGRACAHTQLLSGRSFGGGAPEPSLDPACCGRSVPGAGPISCSASFSPPEVRPHATRPSAGRVRPVWNDVVSRSDELGAGRHEAGFREPPERDEQLAGERHDHHPADPPASPRSALVEPLAERAIGLIAQPAPSHLDELCPDPCRTVAADPLVALRVAAGPRGWRHADPACEFAAVAEPAVEDLVRQDGCVVRPDRLQPGQRRDRGCCSAWNIDPLLGVIGVQN